jgi:GntR family transcriptional repressor for pyruvate dehydrogenase complex
LRSLGALGLVKVKRGRKGGSYISNPPTELVVQSLNLFIKGQDIRFVDLVFVREAIEPAAAAQAALCRSDPQLESLRQHCVDCETTFLNAPAFVEANLKWHLAVTEASNNPLFMTFLSSISNAMHTATDREEFDLTTRKAVVGVHWQIYNAIRERDAEAARRRMLRHLTAYRERLAIAELAGG